MDREESPDSVFQIQTFGKFLEINKNLGYVYIVMVYHNHQANMLWSVDPVHRHKARLSFFG
jgi:recombinational DNA repair protein RecT